MNIDHKNVHRGRIEAGTAIGAIAGMAVFGLIIGTVLEQPFLWLVITGVIGGVTGFIVARNLNKKDKRVK